jgi:membrane protein
MILKERFQKTANALKKLAWKYGRVGESLYKTLVTERRWFAVASAAAEDYWHKKMYYFNGNFTYNAFLAVLALLVAFSALLGIVAQSNKAFSADLVKAFKTTVPLFGAAPKATVDALKTYRSVAGVLGLLALLWTGTRLFYAVEWGFAQIWGIKHRSYLKEKALGAVFVFALGLLFLAALLVQFGFEAAWKWLAGSHGVLFSTGGAAFKLVLGFGVNFGLFFFIFAVVPKVEQSLKKVAIGTAVAASLFLATQYILGYYFRSLSNVPSVYGSLSTAIIIIIWLHVMGLITFFGEELIFVLHHDSVVDEHLARASSWSLFGEPEETK